MVAEVDVVRHEASLTIGRPCEVVEPRLTRQRMCEFDCIADSIDIGIGGL